MSQTKLIAGRAVAVYVDDGQGRRVIIATEDRGVLRNPVVVALTRSELRLAISALRMLEDELPVIAPIVTPPPKVPT